LCKSIKILAIDTSTDACSVAIYLDGVIVEETELTPRSHTRFLLPMIDKLLKQTGTPLNSIDAFAFGCGPGSFTGLRIACSVIQAFGFATNKPCIPISTLRALAQGANRVSGSKKVFASLDARMEEIYWGLFEINKQGVMQGVTEERVQVASEVQLPMGSWEAVMGNPHAQDIVLIAVAEYKLGHTVPAEQALPVYIRNEIIKTKK
jgi:tRNA threonylcarbamoyladenosine biosynthesis protein TsaB